MGDHLLFFLCYKKKTEALSLVQNSTQSHLETFRWPPLFQKWKGGMRQLNICILIEWALIFSILTDDVPVLLIHLKSLPDDTHLQHNLLQTFIF